VPVFGISTSVWILLAGVAIGALALVGMLVRKPKSRPEPWEKAEIMKQLLAMSELEANAAKAKVPARSRASASKQPKRPAPVYLKTPVKAAQPVRSKAR
jgi:hypothetical protein